MARRNTNHKYENSIKYYIRLLSENSIRERFESFRNFQEFLSYRGSPDIHSVPVGFQTYSTSNYTTFRTLLESTAVPITTPATSFHLFDATVPETD